jgi:hypothetical protein
MDPALVTFIVVVAVIAAVPSWLCGSILKKHADLQGGAGSDWIPLSLLPYGLTRFQHKHKFAVVWGYVFSNLLFAAAVIALIILVKKR